MNTIAATARQVSEKLEIQGIEFDSCTFIDISVDGVRIDTEINFDGTIYWPELLRSIEGPGSYLLFTCFCGISDDAGWDPITVLHENGTVVWSFERNGMRRFVFPIADYALAIRECEKTLDLNRFPLAVANAVWPE
jgi:hypothetical protein